MSINTFSKLPLQHFNSTIYDLEYSIPKTSRQIELNFPRSFNKFNPSKKCALSFLDQSRLRCMSNYSESDSSITDNSSQNYSTIKLSQFCDDSDDEIVMFEAQ